MMIIERRRLVTAAVLLRHDPWISERELERKVEAIVSRVTRKTTQVPDWTIDDTGKPGVFVHPRFAAERSGQKQRAFG